MAEKHNPEVLKTLRSNAFDNIKQGRNHTHTFRVDYADVHPDFVGLFEVHRPSVMEQMRIGVIKSQLLGGVTAVDILSDNIATIVATLDTVIDKSPDWFNPWSDELSYEILESVYKEYRDWYNSFRDRDRKSRDGADSEDNRGDSTLEDNEGVQGTTD